MHRYFKKLSSESSSPSTFTSENSHLNQETDEHNTQTQASNFDATTNISSFGRSQVDLSAFSQIQLKKKTDCVNLSFV